MIRDFLSRKPVYNLLHQFPSQMWGEIIGDIVEIGVLSLLKGFQTYELSKNNIKHALNDLKYYNQELSITCPQSYMSKTKEYNLFPLNYQNGDVYEPLSSAKSTSLNPRNRKINYYVSGSSKEKRKATPSKCEVFFNDFNLIKQNLNKNRPRFEYFPNQRNILEENKNYRNRINKRIKKEKKAFRKFIKSCQNENKNSMKDEE